MSESLTSFWIVTPDAVQVRGFGVTAFSEHDALCLFRGAGHDLPQDTDSLQITHSRDPFFRRVQIIADRAGVAHLSPCALRPPPPYKDLTKRCEPRPARCSAFIFFVRPACSHARSRARSLILCLVRLLRLLFALVTLLFTSCVTSPPAVTGPFAAGLSSPDIQQIQKAVSARPDIEHHIRTLEVQRPDRICVKTGHTTDGPDYWQGDGFYVIKRAGSWYIDDRSPIVGVARVKPNY